MNTIATGLLQKVADLFGVPQGAYNIRLNGKSAGRASTEKIAITSKSDRDGIDIHVKPGTKGETVHIPVVLDDSGFSDLVYNDFYIGENSDVLIIAGCGIHNDGGHLTQHNGIHTFHVEKNARVRYVEKHYGEGDGSGERVLNPVTEVFLAEGAYMEMETVQIEGVDSTKRVTRAVVGKDGTFLVKEKLMTSGSQTAETDFEVDLNAPGSKADIASRSVAKGNSIQTFLSRVNGNAACVGHSACDAIIMEQASVRAVPELTANHVDASLIHEAAIGKIAGEQIVKLMTLGLTEEDAQNEIVKGFLR